MRGQGALQTPRSVRSALKEAHERLRAAGVDEARLDGETLLAHVLNVERLKLYLQPDLALNQAQWRAFDQLLMRRADGTPVQRLLGCVSFMGYPLRMRSGVFIPRFETEELVEQASARMPANGKARFLDAGTGSGAIAIALCKRHADAHGVALDCAPEALEAARRNAELNQVAARLQFVRGDWLTAVEGPFDLIVSNPPYVPSQEIEELPPEVRDHDPRLALDGGADGLAAIGILIRQAASRLRVGGWLVFEIGQGQAQAVAALLRGTGYGHVGVQSDLASIGRIAEGQWEGSCRA